MDPNGKLLKVWRTAPDILVGRAKSHILARDWWAKLVSTNKYFNRVVKTFKEQRRKVDGSSDSSGGDRTLSLLEGGEGGMLEEYCEHWEMTHKAFGDHLQDNQGDMPDDYANARLGPEDSDPELNEAADHTDGRPISRNGRAPSPFRTSHFTPVNSNTPGGATADSTTSATTGPSSSVGMTPYNQRSPAAPYRHSVYPQYGPQNTTGGSQTYHSMQASSQAGHGTYADQYGGDFHHQPLPLGGWPMDYSSFQQSRPVPEPEYFLPISYMSASMETPGQGYEEWQGSQRNWNV